MWCRTSSSGMCWRAAPRAFALIGLGLGACSSNDADDSSVIVISSEGAALTAIENAEAALNGMLDSGSFLAESKSLAETLSALGMGRTECTSEYVSCDDLAACTPGFVETCDRTPMSDEDLAQGRAELREGVAEMIAFLKEHVFIEANLDHELTTSTHVTYRLGADVWCADQGDDVSDPQPTGAGLDETNELDATCVENIEKAKPRVRLSQPREGDVNLELVISQRDNVPAVIQLYRDRLGVQVDLGQLLDAARSMGEDVGEVASMSGLLQLQFVKHAALDYSVAFSILDGLKLLLQSDDGEQVSYSVAKTDPALELRVNGESETVSVRYNYGAVHYSAPLEQLMRLIRDDDDDDRTVDPSTAVAPEPAAAKEYTGVVELSLAGYTGTLSYAADSDHFQFRDVSLGNETSTLKHDGNVLAALDLNPENGRGFDMTIRPTADESTEPGQSVLVEVDPTIDVRLNFDFGHLADQVEDLPAVLLGDALRFWFEGDEPAFFVDSDRVRMVSGSLHLESEQASESNLTVSPGMCLTATSSAPPVPDDPAAESPPSDGIAQPGENLFGLETAACE